jgi:hypothetical protein
MYLPLHLMPNINSSIDQTSEVLLAIKCDVNQTSEVNIKCDVNQTSEVNIKCDVNQTSEVFSSLTMRSNKIYDNVIAFALNYKY